MPKSICLQGEKHGIAFLKKPRHSVSLSLLWEGWVMKWVWLSDMQLHAWDKASRYGLYQQVIDAGASGVWLSGDMFEEHRARVVLLELVKAVGVPTYFVLGNRDYYHSSVREMHARMRYALRRDKRLHWLTHESGRMLTEECALVGVDGWADGRLGSKFEGLAIQEDRHRIHDLYCNYMSGKPSLVAKMQAMADQDAVRLERQLLNVFAHHSPKQVFVLSHIPPMLEGVCCGDFDLLPFCASLALGRVLVKVASAQPEACFKVLCGTLSDASVCQLHLCENVLVCMGSVVKALSNEAIIEV